MIEMQYPTTAEEAFIATAAPETKRTRKLGQLKWCRCDEREGWLKEVTVPGMEDAADTASAKKALAAHLTALGTVLEGQRFRLIRDVEEVQPLVQVSRKVHF